MQSLCLLQGGGGREPGTLRSEHGWGCSCSPGPPVRLPAATLQGQAAVAELGAHPLQRYQPRGLWCLCRFSAITGGAQYFAERDVMGQRWFLQVSQTGFGLETGF